jgi:hypothetical protein
MNAPEQARMSSLNCIHPLAFIFFYTIITLIYNVYIHMVFKNNA